MTGDQLKELRESIGLSRTQLAQHLGVDIAIVARMEAGHIRVEPAVADAIRNLRVAPPPPSS